MATLNEEEKKNHNEEILKEPLLIKKHERSALENELYSHFKNKELIKFEMNLDNKLLNEIGLTFNCEFTKLQDIHKFMYSDKSSPFFQYPIDHKKLQLLAKIQHNSKLWKNLFMNCKDNDNEYNHKFDTNIQLWSLIQHQTVHLITSIYKLPNLIQHKLSECIGYDDKNQAKGIDDITRLSMPPYADTMQISTVNMDCIETGIKLKKCGYNPVVLNCANQMAPAAAYKQNEFGTQEENIFKRSTIYLSLWPHRDNEIEHGPAYEYNKIFDKNKDDDKKNNDNESYYPMHDEYGGIYSKNVYILRGSEDNGYAMLPLEERCILSFISVAANVHYLVDDNLSDDEIELYKNKIRTIYKIAYDNGHNCLVLGALGCGIFNNPPQQVAKLFYDILKDEFDGYFARVVFAILWDHNSQPKLVQSFTKYFPKNEKIFEKL